MRLVRAAIVGLAFLPCPASGLRAQGMPAPARAALDSLVDLLVAGELVPGMGVAVVRDGRVIYQRAAGWADREAGRRVDANTVFYIGSVTKPFTALGAVLLDRAGVMGLDATLAQVLPGVAFGAGLDPSRITVRQLLSHTHGISSSGPIVWRAAYSGEIERGAMLRALAAHGAADYGTAYRYTNLGYNILSLAMDSLAGMPWQDVLAQRVFRPLGMSSTSARVSSVPASRLAMPYRPEPGGMARLPYAKADANMQAAGGIVSTVGDLARFVRVVMDGGVLDGRQVVPADVIAEVLRIQARFAERRGFIQTFGYGLGWRYGVLDGDTLVHHFGGFPGFSASVSFLPARRVGVVMAGNGVFMGEVQDVVMGYAYALVLGNDSAVARYRGIFAQLPELASRTGSQIAADRARRAQRPQTTALPLQAYVGRYESGTFGSLVVDIRDGRVHVRNGVLESVAEVYDGARNMLRVELDPGTGSVVEFVAEGDRVTAARYNGYRLERVR